MGPPPEPKPLEAFLERYWKDRESGRVVGLMEYLGAFPGAEEDVAREYLALREPGTEGARRSSGCDVGDSVGPYVIEKEIGRGGQGLVFQARHVRTKGLVALKVVRNLGSRPAAVMMRFKREAAAAARLNHPGICAVYDAGVEGEVPYIAMRLIEGETLARDMERVTHSPSGGATTYSELQPTEDEPRSDDETNGSHGTPRRAPGRAALARLIGQIEKTARALEAVHEMGIVHRDVKPGNIMITPEGEAVIMDFGLARDDEGDLGTLTQTGDLFGTPAYMSPEQLTRQSIRLDGRTDIWSLGVCLYEGATGMRPFAAPTRDALYQQILVKEAVDPRRLNPAVQKDLAVVIQTALQKDRDRRYQTALAFAQDLRRIRKQEPILARAPSRWTRVQRWFQRNRALGLSLVACAALLIIGTTVSTLLAVQAIDDREEKDRAMMLLARSRAEDLIKAEPQLWPLFAKVDSVVQWQDDVRHTLQVMEGGARREQLAALSDRVAQGLAASQTLHARSIADHQEEWDRCVLDLRGQGLVIEPQMGLVPLGRDRASRLWEFWHVESGDQPGWDGSELSGSATRPTPECGLVLILVPGGLCQTGCQTTDVDGPFYDPYGDVDGNRPLIAEHLSPFFLSKFEMTQAQWQRVTGSNPSFWNPADAPGGSGWDHPVENVTWEECVEVLQRVDLLLPTESQWECACRAKTTMLWHTGNDPQSLLGSANVRDVSYHARFPTAPADDSPFDDGHSRHAPVGSLLPNGFGLHDMHGNVYEWCRDDYTDRKGPGAPGDGLRIVPGGHRAATYRGGSWNNPAQSSRSSNRIRMDKSGRNVGSGVRPSRPVRGF